MSAQHPAQGPLLRQLIATSSERGVRRRDCGINLLRGSLRQCAIACVVIFDSVYNLSKSNTWCTVIGVSHRKVYPKWLVTADALTKIVKCILILLPPPKNNTTSARYGTSSMHIARSLNMGGRAKSSSGVVVCQRVINPSLCWRKRQ